MEKYLRYLVYSNTPPQRYFGFAYPISESIKGISETAEQEWSVNPAKQGRLGVYEANTFYTFFRLLQAKISPHSLLHHLIITLNKVIRQLNLPILHRFRKIILYSTHFHTSTFSSNNSIRNILKNQTC